MRLFHGVLPTLVSCSLLSQTSLADDHRTPLIARSAATSDGFYGAVRFDYFDGLDLQEATDLSGWTTALDGTIPISPSMQLRVLLPFRTEAKGTLVKDGTDIEVDGWGGTYDYTSLFFEHQLLGGSAGINHFSYFVGFGARTAVLNTSTPDRYNHTGRSLHLGFRYTRKMNRARLFVDSEFRRYERSDDLNPGDLRKDDFEMFLLTFSWLADASSRHTPAIELTTRKADNYTDIALVPEYLISVSSSLELKLGLPIGLSAQAPNYGAKVELAWFPGR